MTEDEKRIRRLLRDNFEHYARKCLKARTKSGDIISLHLNRVQRYLHEKVEFQKSRTGKVRAIILKGRQQGCSTYVEGRFYWLTTHHTGLRAFILTHDVEATNNLFEMAQRYHEYCPVLVRPSIEASNSRELIFAGLDSGYKLGTAGNKSVGRSSTIQLFHGSEVGFWPHAEEHAKGILQAIPNEAGTEVFLESTANGLGNFYHDQWQKAEAGLSDYQAIFLPWYWQDEYKSAIAEDFKPTPEEDDLIQLYTLTPQQLMWRRMKVVELSAGGFDGTKAFMQEYPCNTVEAFQASGEDSFISPFLAMRARQETCEPYGPLVVGVDPARFGDDRTSIIRRRGRVAFGLQSYDKKDVMEVAGIVHKIIKEEQPYKVFIDVGGLGAGVYDRLKELGYCERGNGVAIGINNGETPLDQDRYKNKRSELWQTMKQWLLDTPCQIPDSNSLHADLCNIKYHFDSNTRLVMEAKADMKKRGARSPNEADALSLTFSYPDIETLEERRKTSANTAKSFFDYDKRIDILKQNAYRSR